MMFCKEKGHCTNAVGALPLEQVGLKGPALPSPSMDGLEEILLLPPPQPEFASVPFPPPPCVFPPSSPTRPGWARLSGGGGGEGWGLFELHHLHFAKGGRGLACTHPHPHPHPFSRSAQGGGPLALLARHWWIRAGDCSSPQPPRLGRGGWVGAGPPPLAAFALADAERAGGQEAREGGGKSFSG